MDLERLRLREGSMLVSFAAAALARERTSVASLRRSASLVACSLLCVARSLMVVVEGNATRDWPTWA